MTGRTVGDAWTDLMNVPSDEDFARLLYLTNRAVWGDSHNETAAALDFWRHVTGRTDHPN